MASGAQVSQNAIDAINEMRHSKEEDKLRILKFGFCDLEKDGKKSTHIDVVERITQKDLDEKNVDGHTYMTKNMLKEDECTYVLYDCKYETKDTGQRSEMFFVMWCPAEAKIQDRMKFASSKDALKNKMSAAVKQKLEVNERSDIITKKDFVESLGRCDITVMEGETL